MMLCMKQPSAVLVMLGALMLWGCDDGEPTVCDEVTCEVAGTVCSEDDGECHCGEVDGPVCGDDQLCDAEAAACLPAACEEVVCELEGTVCGDDGECHCGGDDGPVCGEYESCDAEGGECLPVMPEADCTAGTRWTAGTDAFREATEEWGARGGGRDAAEPGRYRR